LSDQLLPHDAALERLKQLHPVLIDLSLGRMQRLLEALGNPERRLPPVVHVAGTNGKGSTIAFLRAIAEAAGLKVHVFTSPHLVRFNERIRLSGELIGDEHLADVLARVEAVNASEPITFFEITAAAAFQAFSETPADLCIVEVGLGGRFDASNVFDRPALAVIAPVDHDHHEYLGDTLAAIGGEKAGIIKAGAPVVVAHQDAEAFEVIEAAAQRLGAPLTLAGRDFDAHAEAGRLIYQDEAALLDLPSPSLFGVHQFDNAGLAIAAARAIAPLFPGRIDERAIAAGVAGAVWPARMQRLTQGPLADLAKASGADLWLDGGHNPHAARALAANARTLSGRDGRPLVLIVGLVARKDADGVFEAFSDLGAAVFTTGFDSPLAANPERLAAVARRRGLAAVACRDVTQALRQVLAGPGSPAHILICGSLYLAGEVLALTQETWPT
jgi:dihydrofolate synthase/folylpolyglutamate synthase